MTTQFFTKRTRDIADTLLGTPLTEENLKPLFQYLGAQAYLIRSGPPQNPPHPTSGNYYATRLYQTGQMTLSLELSGRYDHQKPSIECANLTLESIDKDEIETFLDRLYSTFRSRKKDERQARMRNFERQLINASCASW
ncbi:MAG: hypothetical protein AABX70_00905 [Nanoarchaeota archaeon]